MRVALIPAELTLIFGRTHWHFSAWPFGASALHTHAGPHAAQLSAFAVLFAARL
jgi:hypothetical protein